MSGKRKEEARRWFQQARYDLKATQWNMAVDANEAAKRIFEAVASYYRAQGETEILEE